MKKLFAILLVLVMVFAMTTTAFAAENTTLTITNSDGREYAGHKLLGLTTSLKTDEHHPDDCTGEHGPDCYNYAYTVTPAYRDILKAETFAYGGNYLWDAYPKPATAEGISDEQILMYLANQTSDEGGVYHTMRTVADRLYRAIKTEGIAAEAPNLTGNDTLAQGYWIIADVTSLTGNQANSLVMVDTKGMDALTINPKIGLPTIEKKVKDIDDSEDANILDNPWYDSADHDFGDTIPFKLTATLPSNAQGFETYKIIFHDQLSAGLTLDAASIKVYMYETANKATVDTDLNDGTDVTEKFVITTTGLTDGCTFEVACENVFGINGVTKDTAFVVSYNATLNASATVGAAGNPNEVYLEFSNDPYSNSTGTTEKDKVTVFTYQVIINKVDTHGHALKGAGFKLYKKNLATGDFEIIGEELKGADMTTFTWTGLDDGDYKLEESTVPEGYNKMADILFSITAAHEENAADPALTTLDGGIIGTGVVDTGAITKNIENKTGAVLPETGAQGTFMLITAGALLVILATVFMITRKKMSIYED